MELPSLVVDEKGIDRIAVEPIVRLTRPTVLNVLREVQFVVHTVVPEKYRFWKSNQSGQGCLGKQPITLKRGPLGKVGFGLRF